MRFMSPGPGRDDDRKGIERELKRGSLELIVLHLLSAGEAVGEYTIKTIHPDSAVITDGPLYPVLYRSSERIRRHRWECRSASWRCLTEAGQAEPFG
jgi:hypothetical protein